ncbi:hypothetical protein KBTX_02661 [wastewater metagenome]|uniref:Transposase n=2 Tax=unclassified sequences TaxID=12908 RepID=A0A5B8RAW3_9ZZZZ|nr:transposase [Arhodomonas sp. KWT]QEA06329.1 hypothetical protein KBTEX_02661 [uncultured organism]
MERIEVVTGVQRRRRYSPREKAELVALCEQPGMSVSLVAAGHNIRLLLRAMAALLRQLLGRLLVFLGAGIDHQDARAAIPTAA